MLNVDEKTVASEEISSEYRALNLRQTEGVVERQSRELQESLRDAKSLDLAAVGRDEGGPTGSSAEDVDLGSTGKTEMSAPLSIRKCWSEAASNTDIEPTPEMVLREILAPDVLNVRLWSFPPRRTAEAW